MTTTLSSKSFFIGLAITILVIGLNFINLEHVQKLLQRVEGILYDTRLLVTLPNNALMNKLLLLILMKKVCVSKGDTLGVAVKLVI